MLDTDDFTTLAASDNPDDLQDALAIYQGDYLCESCNESWANTVREQMRETYLQCALKLAQSLLSADQYDEAMRISHEILAADPCNEPAFQVLMQCHAARGNRAAVHSVYQRCISILREDMDVEPSKETSILYKKLTQ
ncbi:MAG: hypothetical protein HGB17_17690 [Syntrophobacteraceae bacterium]|nr:hypothetical protein [Syntrophobacteraceae bacterium]